MMPEDEKRNVQRLRDAMEEIAANSPYEVWRIADLALDAYKIGKAGGTKEYEKNLDLLINPTI